MPRGLCLRLTALAVLAVLAAEPVAGFSFCNAASALGIAAPLGARGPADPARPASRRAPARPASSLLSLAASSTADAPRRPVTKLRLIQHKAEAFWFYRSCIRAWPPPRVMGTLPRAS